VKKLIKAQLRARYGWIPLYEIRNKVRLGHTAPGLYRFERSEAERLLATMPGGVRPRALVATIVLTYKRHEDLRKAVASVLAQTVTDQVVVVVDDGGGLPELPADPRLFAVSLSRNRNVLGVSRNIGMRITDSRYVAFLDDDNTWHPHHLETALARLQGDDRPGEPRPEAVYTAMLRATPDGEVRDVLSVPFDRKVAMNRSFLDSNPFVATRSPDLFFSRLKRGRKVGPKEDWELVWRYSKRHRVEHIPEVTVNYTVNPNSYWTSWETA
jgi:glycosyltransferase involved in cell wall biosynthesis